MAPCQFAVFLTSHSGTEETLLDKEETASGLWWCFGCWLWFLFGALFGFGVACVLFSSSCVSFPFNDDLALLPHGIRTRGKKNPVLWNVCSAAEHSSLSAKRIFSQKFCTPRRPRFSTDQTESRKQFLCVPRGTSHHDENKWGERGMSLTSNDQQNQTASSSGHHLKSALRCNTSTSNKLNMIPHLTRRCSPRSTQKVVSVGFSQELTRCHHS